MIEVYEKIPRRGKMLEQTIPDLRELCKRLGVAPGSSKDNMIARIQSFVRNKYNTGNLYFMYKKQSEAEKKKIKKAQADAKKEAEKKKEEKAEVVEQISELHKKLEG